ncbi:MAG: SixA phosphatase family protein [Adhaeribacter sp.]
MFKYLFICRHADAAAAVAGQPDFDRPLSSRGIAQARSAAQWVLQSGIPVSMLHCSAARRTQETARIFAEILQLPDSALKPDPAWYQATARDLLESIEDWPADRQQGLLIGHNPAVSALVGQFNSSPHHYVPTGGVNLFTFAAADWQEISWSEAKWQANY